MTPEQQRIAIAEACGWSRIEYYVAVSSGKQMLGAVGDLYGTPPQDKNKKEDDQSFVRLPNYLDDLNAMHEAEKVLTGEECLKYADELNKATHCFKHITPAIMIFSTAAQRAEAFLRTINKWKD